MSDVNSRFQRQETVQQSPGCCFICRNNQGPYINTGCSLPFDGVIFICQTCLIEMYRQMDITDPEKQDIQKQRELFWQDGVKHGELQTMEKIRGYLDTYSLDATPGSVPGVPDVPASDDSESGSEDHEGPGGSEPGTDSGALEGSLADLFAGRDDLSSDSGDGKPAARKSKS